MSSWSSKAKKVPAVGRNFLGANRYEVALGEIIPVLSRFLTYEQVAPSPFPGGVGAALNNNQKGDELRV